MDTAVTKSIATITADPTLSASGGIDRTNAPPIPVVEEDLPTYYGTNDLLSFCMWQVRQSDDKAAVMRAICSAVGSILGVTANLTGSSIAAVELTGYDAVGDQDADVNSAAVTNFAGASTVTIGEWRETGAYDTTEMAGYFAVLLLAGCKAPSELNLKAFNENRAAAATRAVKGAKKIFVPASPWLTLEILSGVQASFNAYAPCRVHLINNIVQRVSRGVTMGDVSIFTRLFMLLADFGLTNLVIIKEAILHQPEIAALPELRIGLIAAAKAFTALQNIDAPIRPFCKAMFAEALVLAPPADLDLLLRVSRIVLIPIHPTYERYLGTPEAQSLPATLGTKVARIMGVEPATPASEERDVAEPAE